MSKTLDWDTYFMLLAHTVAMKSKDQRTRCGCVIVGPDREIRSTGYNSFPRGIDDSRPERQERPEKYFWFAHAERNAIYNAARMGTSLKDCDLYVTRTPCTDCSIAIIQAGIRRVIVHDFKCEHMPAGKQGNPNTTKTLELFAEAGVEFRIWTGRVPRMQVLMNSVDVTDLVVEYNDDE
jgi:dCMP deaminase